MHGDRKSNTLHEAFYDEAHWSVSNLQILLSYFEIETIDYSSIVRQLERKIREIENVNKKLVEEKGFIEEIKGSFSFYEHYHKLHDGMDYGDTCYFFSF